jgi:peptidoglycan/xylan/chitin deacetylase (PgdA/CDA1 family)
MSHPPAPPGALVLSLDFELHWGVRDKHPAGGAYTPNLLGARTVIPRLLELFEEFDVAVTWATVGFLFARSRDELERYSPSVRPEYRDPRLCPYTENLGQGEDDDPLHYAPSLIERIRRSPRQEIATHTFSHYFPGEAGQNEQAFRADLAAARAIAGARGVELRSIVFPRNQHNPAYDQALLDHGIRAYRGNPDSWMWRFANAEESAGRAKRAARLLSSYVDFSGAGTIGWQDVLKPNGLADVRASFLVRRYQPKLRHLEPLRLAQVCRSLRAAAGTRSILHLWWHPHNFGTFQEENLTFLRGILAEFRRCRERHGMLSLSMAEVERVARGLPGAEHTSACSHAASSRR